MRLFIALSFLLYSNLTFAIDIHFEKLPVSKFSSWYSQIIDMPIVVEPEAQDKLISVFGGSAEIDELPEFVRSVLNAHGLDITGYSPALVHLIRDFNSELGDDLTVDPSLRGYAISPGKSGDTEKLPDIPFSSEIVTFYDVRASDMQEIALNFISAKGADGVNVSVIDSTNSLFLTGPEYLVSDFASYREQLDQPRAQVYIKALFYETAEGDNLDLGLAYGDRTVTDGPAFTLDGIRLGNSLSPVGASFGIFDNGILNFAITAIQKSKSAKILSTPQILALSGSRGTITVGQNIPVITGKQTGEASSTSSPFQTIERRDVGLMLSVLPSVLSDKSIVLDVVAKSDSVGESTVTTDVVTNQRNISTTVKIANGQTLLLGGLAADDNKISYSGVPFLKDIPYLGVLFRSQSDSKEKRVLNILIEATVI